MSNESIRVSAVIPARPEQIYAAWLDGPGHTKMTGGAATGEARVGARHTAWGGYISGETLALDAGRGFVQSWRAMDFPEGSGDSTISVRLDAEGDGTRVTIDHNELPEGTGVRFEQGWEEHYFAPMKAYFGKVATLAAATATRAAAAKAKPKAKAKARPKAKAAAPKAKAKAKPKAKPKAAAKRKAVAKSASKRKAAPKKKAAKKRPVKKSPARKPKRR